MASGRKSVFDSDVAALIFQNAGISGIGDSTGIVGSSAAGNLYLALYLELDMGGSSYGSEYSSSGWQEEYEEAYYENYERVAIPRSSAGWTIAGTDVTNTNEVNFPECGGSEVHYVNAFAICKSDQVGVDDAIFLGVFPAMVTIEPGDIPTFEIGEFLIL